MDRHASREQPDKRVELTDRASPCTRGCGSSLAHPGPPPVRFPFALGDDLKSFPAFGDDREVRLQLELRSPGLRNIREAITSREATGAGGRARPGQR